jgi:CPA2 family monovalent cation:H+ antiporter-2
MNILSRIDPVVGAISAVAILLVIIGFLLKKVKQPYIIGYIFIGVLFGENVLGIVKNPETIHHVGEIGILLLLFFIGLEISLPKLVQQWKIAAVGTTLQVLISVVIMFGIGYIFGWQTQRIILLGFVIALSSSAVIIKLLQDNNLLNTKIGKNVLSILLTQDIIIVPMLICTSLMGGKGESALNIIVMVIRWYFIYSNVGLHIQTPECAASFFGKNSGRPRVAGFLSNYFLLRRGLTDLFIWVVSRSWCFCGRDVLAQLKIYRMDSRYPPRIPSNICGVFLRRSRVTNRF